MNLWALDKDLSIKLFLILFSERYGADSFTIDQDRGLHYRAVRILSVDNPTLSAYVYVYGQTAGHYGLHLEYPLHQDVDVTSSLDLHEGMTIDELIDLLSMHFDLAGSTRHARSQNGAGKR